MINILRTIFFSSNKPSNCSLSFFKAFARQLACVLQKRIEGYPKKFKAREGTGKVEKLLEIWDIAEEMAVGEWLILVRNTFLSKDIIDFLRKQGFSYETQFSKPQNVQSLKALKAWADLRKGEKITLPQIKTMVSFMDYTAFNFEALKELTDSRTKYNIEALKQSIGLNLDFKEPWQKALYRMGKDDISYYQTATTKGENLFRKPRIYVGTIHSAKGGECENVVLFTGISNRTYNGFTSGPHWRDEYRVFYVGVTRSKENLYIVPNRKVKNQFQLGRF